jgi:hypothetical protein
VAPWAAHLASEYGDSDAGEAIDQSARQRQQRLDKRHRFRCLACTQQFASAQELNEHLGTAHPEPAQHAKGAVSAPVRHIPPTRRAKPPGHPGGGTQRPKKRIDNRRKAVEKLAAPATAQLGDIGSVPVRTVSQIEEIAHAIEGIALQLQEAVEGFQHNARTSEEAPIDEGVLRQLDQAKSGAEEVARSAVKFIGAFFDYYREDIREAQAHQRMSNQALTS